MRAARSTAKYLRLVEPTPLDIGWRFRVENFRSCQQAKLATAPPLNKTIEAALRGSKL